MTPILYASNETNFSTLGLGVLNEAVQCHVKTVLNGLFGLEMQYPVSGKRYSDIQVSNIIKAVAEKGGQPQLFDIYSITKPLNGIITVYASHVSGRKQFIPIMPFTSSSVVTAMQNLSTYSAETNPFTFYTDKTTSGNFKLTVPVSLGSALGGMEGSILDVYGGEYEFDNFTIKLLGHRGQDNGVTLRYGKNITSIEQEESIASTITGICPFWTDLDGNTIVLPEKTVDSANAANFPFKRTIPYDFSQSFDTAPTEAQLRAAAQAYVARSSVGVPSVGIDLSYENLADYEEFADVALLEQVKLGDTVHVYFDPLDITVTARVTATDYDCLLEKYKTVRIGSVKSSLSQVINSSNEEVKHAVNDSQTALERAFAEALEAFSGADGGNIVIRKNQTTGKPYEILIMDTDNINTAVKVLRLNDAGLGYSENGINGPYTAAITGSGIVATAITAGILSGIEIIGELGKIGGWEINDHAIFSEKVYNGTTYKPYLLAPTGAITDATKAYVVEKITGNTTETPFYVTYGGKLHAEDAEISGQISGSTILSSSFSAGRDIVLYKADYTQSDLTRLTNIITGSVTPTTADYEKLDVNKDGEFDVLDVAILSSLLNGSATSLTLNCSVVIDVDSNTDEIIKVGGLTKIGRQTLKTNTLEATNIKNFGYLGSSDGKLWYSGNQFYWDGGYIFGAIFWGDITNGCIRFVQPKLQIVWKQVEWTGEINQAWGSGIYESSQAISIGSWYAEFSDTPSVAYSATSSGNLTAWVAAGSVAPTKYVGGSVYLERGGTTGASQKWTIRVIAIGTYT